MPAPTPTTLVDGSRLQSLDPWADLDAFREWSNGGAGNVEGDFDDVRYIHLPRPALLGFPVNAMLGETQDVHGQQFVGGAKPGWDREVRHRQVIYGDCLDGNYQCRIVGLATRFRMPLYGRVHIEASFAHRLWAEAAPYGAGQIAGTETAYFSMWYGPVNGNTFTEILGTRRHTARFFNEPRDTNNPSLEPSHYNANMVAALSTKNTAAPYMVTGDEDLAVFVAFTAPPNTLFSSGFAGIGNGNRVRCDVLNTSLMVRVWKNVST